MGTLAALAVSSGVLSLGASVAPTVGTATVPATTEVAKTTVNGFTVVHDYVTVNGVQLSLAVSYPPGAYGDTGHDWPALFEMDGYQGYPSPNDNEFFAKDPKYVDVYAQLRGTGCSGGTFDLFSQQSAQDGAAVIDDWIPAQGWSNGNVGLTGHSYSGLTGFMVAEQSPHVKAIAVSGLIDDFYRSILYPGGIFNEGFPVLWGAILRPESQFSGNAGNYETDSICQRNELAHQGTDTVPLQLIEPVYTQSTATPNSWAISHSLFQNVGNIDAPIQINQQYQDEQTGPRGGYLLWQELPAGLPKRLVLSNGQHNPNDAAGDKGAWLDCYVIDQPAGLPCPTVTGETGSGLTVTTSVNDPSARVLMYFDSLGTSSAAQTRDTPYLTSDWPAPETAWQYLYLHPDGTLDANQTTAATAGNVSYLSTTTDEHTSGTLGNALPVPPAGTNLGQVTFVHGPNEARWQTAPFATPTAISGPMLLDLYLRSTAPDTDVFADVLDLDTATGQMEYLQRGLLRESFRAVIPSQSQAISIGPLAGTIYRPYHDYLTKKLSFPNQVDFMPVEIFPVGHVFYPGHALVIDVHAPPANDPLSTYAYEPLQAPAVNTVVMNIGMESSLLVPFMPVVPPLWPTQPPCADIAGYLCFTPLH
ncbi:MAG TPA: CocE/NonD family hydrolase [Acidimicrobiales bacterium]|nr:CocE/NonD family hydrolase [Acidimicrobiales bacterium]